MKFACGHGENSGLDWRETLSIAIDLTFPDLPSIESLMDKAETGAWSGLWW